MKGYGDYIKFHLKSATNPLVVRTSFKALDMELPKNKFIVLNKINSVAIGEITAIRKNSIFLGEKELSVGETFRNSVEKLIGRND